MVNLLFNLKLLTHGILMDSWTVASGEDGISGNIPGCGEIKLTELSQLVCEKLILPGWYVIEFSFHEESQGTAALHLEYDAKNRISEKIIIPYKNGTVKKRFFHLPQKCVRMRFESGQSHSGHTILQQLKVRRVPRRFAVTRIDRKIVEAGILLKPGIRMEIYGELFNKPTIVDYAQYLREVEPLLVTPEMAKPSVWVSVMMSLSQASIATLEKTVTSLRAQSYGNWEMLLALHENWDGELKDHAEMLASTDNRIMLVPVANGKSVCSDYEELLSQCKGDFVAIVSAGDSVPCYALNEMVHTIQKNPDLKILYSDEDTVDDRGNRSEPHFKPDWNYHLLLGINYISRFCLVQTSFLKKMGGFRSQAGDYCEYDILLRASRVCEPEHISHVSMVLYHNQFRETKNAAAFSDARLNACNALEVVRAHFAHSPDIIRKITEGEIPHSCRVQWALPKATPKVSLIMPTFNAHEVTRRAVNSILQKTTYPNFEICIVDNNSNEPESLQYFETIEAVPNVRVIRYNKDFNFSAINNYAVRFATGEIVGLLNNDIEVIAEEWLSEMVSLAVLPRVGCVGAKLLYPDGRIQHGGVILGIGGVAGHSHKYMRRDDDGYFGRLKLVQNLSAVTAACLLVRRDVYDEVGGLNENDLKVAFNDVDFCLRVGQKGYSNIWTPYATLYHHESYSRGTEESPKKRARFREESKYMRRVWGALLMNDPFYNRNLTLDHENFTFTRFPR